MSKVGSAPLVHQVPQALRTAQCPKSMVQKRYFLAGAAVFRTFFMAVLFVMTLDIGLWTLAAFGEDSRFYQDVQVQPGDTWWSLSERYLKDPSRWPEIARQNQLPASDPTMALPGQMLKIPVLMIKENLRSAKLVEIQRLVEHRHRDSPQWKNGSMNMELKQDDGIRTGELSQARVRFAQGEDLTLGPRSFAVIRPEGSSRRSGQETSLLSGEARSLGATIVTQSARITPKSKTVDYRARVREDLATVVEVYKGSADVESQNKVVLVKEGFATEVLMGKVPGAPMALPQLPQKVVIEKFWDPEAISTSTMESPMAAGLLLQGSVLRWQQGSLSKMSSRSGIGQGLSTMKIQLAQNPQGALLMEEVVSIHEAFSFNEIDLADGSYVYRVSFQDRLGFEGPFGDWQKLSIDRVAPELVIIEPDQEFFLSRKAVVSVKGRSESGALIRIGGISLRTQDQGEFSLDVVLRPGENRLVVAAVDAAGNTQKKILTVDYEEESSESSSSSAQEDRRWRQMQSSQKDAPPADKLVRMTIGTAVAAVIIGVIALLLF